ncbi:MAG TPA: OmpH family outer membrane protein [Terriglobales bacterium]|nr:OmpH family outer membrane protein [Terriglobales bacterium]
MARPAHFWFTLTLSGALLASSGAAQTTAKPPAAAPAAAANADALPPLPPPPTVTGPSKIGFINITQAIASTAEGKKLLAALQAKFAPRQTDLQNQQKAIEALQKRLQDGGSLLSQAAKDDLTRQIQSKQRDFNQALQNSQQDYQSAESDVLNTVGNKLLPVLKTYADQHGYTAIVDISQQWPSQPVLYFNPGANVTADIIKLYDEQHPGA